MLEWLYLPNKSIGWTYDRYSVIINVMKKLIVEVLVSIIFVFGSTYFVYTYLANTGSFWNTQSFWSIGLALGWIVVAAGYYHQGWLVRTRNKADDVSIFLPIAVFLVQCVLFVKGIYYNDWSLIWGALVVNSGVIFSLSQILRIRRNK
jgi:hypothetical protein